MDKSEIVAFGDNLNDFEMLDFAGTAIATENARQEIMTSQMKSLGTVMRSLSWLTWKDW